MLAAHERTARSVLALQEGHPGEISLYGCVAAEAGRRVPGPGARPRREAGPRGGALGPGGHGPLRADPGHLRRHRPDRARPGRRDPAHRRHQGPARRPSRSTATPSREGRFDVGNKLDYLRATVELALEREDLGPPFRAFLEERLRIVMIPLAEAQAEVIEACPPKPPRVVGGRRRRRAGAGRAGDRGRGRAAVRQHGHGRLRGAGRRRGRRPAPTSPPG